MLVSSLSSCSGSPSLVDHPMYLAIKFIHVSCAILSILGFTIRGLLVFSKQAQFDRFIFKVLPHVIDTVLLASAITLVILSGQYPYSSPWITAKIIALLIYIGLGVCFMRFARTKLQQSYFFTLALISAAYIVLVAITKDPLPLFN
jgi:uncharacterized membrane protein SirB2